MDTLLCLNRRQDSDQRNFKMEDTKRIYGQCPICKKGYLVKETFFNGIIFNRIKTVIFYCPYCDFRNTHIFRLNENQYQREQEKECGGIHY